MPGIEQPVHARLGPIEHARDVADVDPQRDRDHGVGQAPVVQSQRHGVGIRELRERMRTAHPVDTTDVSVRTSQ